MSGLSPTSFRALDPPYSVIYADFPWSYRDTANAGHRGAQWKYPTMKDKEILAFPMTDLAAPDCALLSWATGPKMDFAIDALEAWGFKYTTIAFTWVKLTKKGKRWHWGMGRHTRANPEFVLLGTKGRPIRMSAGVHSVIEAPVREHSRKPDETRDRIVRLYGDVHRVELFARQRTPGWDTWGLEVPVQRAA